MYYSLSNTTTSAAASLGKSVYVNQNNEGTGTFRTTPSPLANIINLELNLLTNLLNSQHKFEPYIVVDTEDMFNYFTVYQHCKCSTCAE